MQRNSSLPDEENVARLQEELIAVKLREAESLMGLKELRQQVKDLEEHWQVCMGSNTLKWVFIFNDKAKDYKILRYWDQAETNDYG